MPSLCENQSDNYNIHILKGKCKCVIAIVFGRPGAGKTTVAEETKSQFYNNDVNHENTLFLDLDLDVCIPTWMKDNFGKGIYPTSSERNEFAISACYYVENEIQKICERENDPLKSLFVLISFSFVNDDLRQVFRTRFPTALWMLMDVNDKTAQDRIERRSGHFYNGKKPKLDDPKTNLSTEQKDEAEKSSNNKHDNSEWEFAPVTFPHIVLCGTASVETNASIVKKALLESIQQ